MSTENNCGSGCGAYVPWLDLSEEEKEKIRREKEELERKAERRIAQGRLALYLSGSVVKDEVYRVCGVSTDVELMSLIVDEIDDGE